MIAVDTTIDRLQKALPLQKQILNITYLHALHAYQKLPKITHKINEALHELGLIMLNY